MTIIAELAQTLGSLNATDCSSEEAVANYLMMKLHGYSFNGSRKVNEDARLIADVLQAYAKLIQDADIKII